MNTLIVKLGATGDVVRTTTLLRKLKGRVTWITTAMNRAILPELHEDSRELRVVTWEERSQIADHSYDLVINLEDDEAVGAWLNSIRAPKLFGAFMTPQGRMAYTEDSSGWFDMSLISVHGRERADAIKLHNRRTYQDLIFEGLGWSFSGQEYWLPSTHASDLRGDVAIASESGPVWPMKKWAHYDRLKHQLEAVGLKVNYLPRRATLLEHLADVRGHRCLISGDTLPMHLALGSGILGVALFNCTSPWEIHDYGRLTKLISPLLPEFFYGRGFDERVTKSILLDDVVAATRAVLKMSTEATAC